MIIDQQDIIDTVKAMPAPKEAAYVRRPSEVLDAVINAFHDPSFQRAGYPLPYSDFDNLFRFRDGEVTVWSGENHTGKSEALNQYVLFHSQRIKTFVMSPEMPVYRTLQYMACQATAQGKPSKMAITHFIQEIEHKIYLLDQSSTFNPQMVINLIRYVVQEFGVKQIVIDSLMKCGINENDDHGKIKWFVDQLCVLAKALEIHIHIVAHAMKPKDRARPTRYSIKGSGAISDLVDNVIIMWRNEEKEHELQEGVNDIRMQELGNEPDGRMIIDKQRHGTGWRGMINLWHWSEQRVFLPNRAARPVMANLGTPLVAVSQFNGGQ